MSFDHYIDCHQYMRIGNHLDGVKLNELIRRRDEVKGLSSELRIKENMRSKAFYYLIKLSGLILDFENYLEHYLMDI